MMLSVSQANLASFSVAAFVITAIAALAVLSARGDEAEAATTHTVFVNNSVFCGSASVGCGQPFSTTISVGDTVQWLDGQSGTLHTVTQCTGDGAGCPGGTPGFDSGFLTDPPSGYLTQAFPSAGTFFYRCEVHGNSMRGIITVASTPPIPVGGIADFPDIDELPADAAGSSDGSSFALAALVGGLVAALAMFAAGAWYARRRWLR